MEFLTSTPAVIGMVVSAILLGLLKDEVSACLPLLTCKIIKLAVSRTPMDKQLRYNEEWSAHVLEYPGKLTQLFQALSLLVASRRLIKRTYLQKLKREFYLCFWISMVCNAIPIYCYAADLPKSFLPLVLLGLVLVFACTGRGAYLYRQIRRERKLDKEPSPD